MVHRRVWSLPLNSITEKYLDALMENFVSTFPTAGQKTLVSSLGYRIQNVRVRESVDPMHLYHLLYSHEDEGLLCLGPAG